MKKLSGNDTITTRDLHKSTISYKPQFCLFIQCNAKPQLNKIDKGIIRRFKIINYPFNFVDNPTDKYDKQIDRELKEKLSMLTGENKLINEFMLLLLETAKKYKNIALKDIEIPKQIKDENRVFTRQDAGTRRSTGIHQGSGQVAAAHVFGQRPGHVRTGQIGQIVGREIGEVLHGLRA